MDDFRYQLSSKLTLFYKFIPLAIFIFLIASAAAELAGQTISLRAPKLIGFLIFLGVIGFVAIRFALPIKTAYLAGNMVVVSNFLTQIEIPIQNIELVDGPDMTSWRRIIIYLDHESRFGNRLVIVPGFFRATNVANYLREKVDKLT